MTSILTYLTISLMAANPSMQAEINAAVNEYYNSVMAERALDWEIEVGHVPAIRGDNFRITGVRSDETDYLPRGSRLCWLDILVDNEERSLPIPVVVSPEELVPVSKYDIPSRTALNDSLIEWKKMNTEKLGAAVVPSRNELRGLWSRVRIPSGAIITDDRLSPTPAVEIGQTVVLVTQMGLVEVKTSGRSMQDGVIGERIKVENLESGRRLKGRIKARGVVEVE